jgi:hypothetical protein
VAADRGVLRGPRSRARGRITSPFNARSTAAEVVAGIDLRDKRAVITGGSSGIGTETARRLASVGADVILAVRHPQRRSSRRVEINDSRDGQRVARLGPIDLGSVRSVAEQGARCPYTCQSTTRASWPRHSTAPLPDGSRSSPPTTSGTSPRPSRHTTP